MVGDFLNYSSMLFSFESALLLVGQLIGVMYLLVTLKDAKAVFAVSILCLRILEYRFEVAAVVI